MNMALFEGDDDARQQLCFVLSETILNIRKGVMYQARQLAGPDDDHFYRLLKTLPFNGYMDG